MKSAKRSLTILSVLAACLGSWTTGSFAAEISTPAIPTVGFGETITDPLGVVADYTCTVTNLTNKTQSVSISFVNENGEVIPALGDPYPSFCDPQAGTQVDVGPGQSYPASCPITLYLLPPTDFRQEAVRCTVDELTGNTANWRVLICAAPSLTTGGATVCAEGF